MRPLPSSTIGLTSVFVLLWVSALHLMALAALSLTPSDLPLSRLVLEGWRACYLILALVMFVGTLPFTLL